jgi:hypothetical protein
MPKVAVQVSALDSLLQASFIVQLTLLILIFLSIFYWLQSDGDISADANAAGSTGSCYHL